MIRSLPLYAAASRPTGAGPTRMQKERKENVRQLQPITLSGGGQL